MIVAGRLEPDDDGPADGGELLGRTVIVRLGREHRQAPTSAAFGTLYKHLLPVLRHVGCYQHGGGRCRRELGHGRPASKMLSRQAHFRDPLAGHDLPLWSLRPLRGLASIRALAAPVPTFPNVLRYRADQPGDPEMDAGAIGRVALHAPGKPQQNG